MTSQCLGQVRASGPQVRGTNRQASQGARRCDVLVRGGLVLTVDAAMSVHEPGAVAVLDGRIADVGDDAAVCRRWTADEVVDAAGGVVHPGFVEPHGHVTYHTTRGALPDTLAVEEYIASYARWVNAMDADDEDASARLAFVEMLHSGVTAFMEGGTTFVPEVVARAAEDLGIRGSVAEPYLWDRVFSLSDSVDAAPPSLDRCKQLLGSELWRNDDPDALVRGHVALYGSGTASVELQRLAKEAADGAGAVLAQHQSLEPGTYDADVRTYGEPPFVHFDKLGLLGPRATFVHVNVIADEEIPPLAAAGSSVVWVPGNFLNYSVGSTHPCRVPDLHRAGVPIGLASDVAKVWAFAEQPLLGYLAVRENGDLIVAADLVRMATAGGARCMGLEGEIGSLEVGKRADVVVREARTPTAFPGVDPVRELVLVAKGRGVRTVVVDGRVVLRDGRLVSADEAAIYDRARASARRLSALAFGAAKGRT